MWSGSGSCGGRRLRSWRLFSTPLWETDVRFDARRADAADPRLFGENPDPIDFYQEDSFADDLALAAAVLAQVTGETPFQADALGFARMLTPDAGSPIYWGGAKPAESLSAEVYRERNV